MSEEDYHGWKRKLFRQKIKESKVTYGEETPSKQLTSVVVKPEESEGNNTDMSINALNNIVSSTQEATGVQAVVIDVERSETPILVPDLGAQSFRVKDEDEVSVFK